MKTADIDALARLLDGTSPNGDAPEEARALAALAQAMEARATVTPRPEFRAELRDRLLAEAAAPPAPSWLTRMRASTDAMLARWKYSVRVATASAMAAMTLSTGGVAVAATMSVPGDLFYPLKIAVEDARLTRADTDATRGSMLLDFAENRVAEAERAAAADRMDAAADALVAADDHLRRGAGEVIEGFLDSGDYAELEVLTDFTAALRPRLEGLREQTGPPATGALDDLLVSLGRVDARVEALIAGCCPDSPGAARPGIPAPGVGFDFTRIPAADEPFDACPCPPAASPAPEPAPTPTPTPEPAPTEPPTDGPAPTEPPQPTEPPAETPAPEETPEGVLPPPLQEPVDEIQDTLDQIIEDVLGPGLRATPSPADELLDDAGGLLDEVGRRLLP